MIAGLSADGWTSVGFIFSSLPGAVAHFRSAGGTAALSTREGTAQQLGDLLFDGQLDCVVGRLSSAGVPEGRDLADLSFTPLYDEQICVVEGTSGRPGPKPGYADLARREWVLQRRDSSVRRGLADAFLRHRGQTVGRLDTRFLGLDRDDAGEKPEEDAADRKSVV